MFENPDLTTFIYILIACAIIMGAVWYFILAPMERRNHERKLENLQRRIKEHQAQIKNPTGSGEQNSPE